MLLDTSKGASRAAEVSGMKALAPGAAFPLADQFRTIVRADELTLTELASELTRVLRGYTRDGLSLATATMAVATLVQVLASVQNQLGPVELAQVLLALTVDAELCEESAARGGETLQ